MTRPAIAIIGRRAESVPILRFSATLAAEAMCEAVYAAGGEPLVLHGLGRDPADGLGDRLERFGGVLVPGGADLDPALYGQEPIAETTGVVSFQDLLDVAVTQEVVARRLPTLAICRGMQVLNVVCGGTLVQDLPESSVSHRNAPHLASVIEGSRLADIVRTGTVEVSSYHHQAVDRLGTSLVVSARAADGVVEAVEHTAADILGVQWHPEDLHDSSPTDAALFADLVERARRKDGSQ
ncbi:MAG: gamma-glutamyl-gamma-aminobutyrate hydrolase family protein [Micrococcales bacterium]|nr:gamma-glutamyl-gamma-aminobutyrate hydrolase family protein [Micrococcales bacterium]